MMEKKKVWFMWLCNIAALTVLLMFGVQCRRAWSPEYQAEKSERAVERSCDPEVIKQWATQLVASEDLYKDTYPPAHPDLQHIWKRSPRVQIRGKIWGNKGPPYVWVAWGSGELGGRLARSSE